jgi:N-acetylglutamate synthase-like GNAT family acetyltransferase
MLLYQYNVSINCKGADVLKNNEILVRRFRKEDSLRVSELIRENLIKVNIKDYPEKIIKNMFERFTPEFINTIDNSRKIFVAEYNDVVVGTASLDNDKVYTVFVDMNYHGRGVGKELMSNIERTALESGIKSLQLPASLTASEFYKKLGYHVVMEAESEENGKNIVMEKYL